MQVDKETIQIVKLTVEKHGFIDLPSSGQSMFPLIRTGDLCRFVRCDRNELVPGDILLFRSREGALVGHRYLHKRKQGDEHVLICKGDSNLTCDAPVPYREIIGKLLWIKKPQRLILSTHYRARVLGKALIRFPNWSRYIAMYLRWKKTL
ncbi:signal peptidase I [Paenibacillus daejeonensis]|uniref:signal peptidase I n=1 Tax=Paenibacillus daejeonensis TaxID=135193 RepID=UPI00037A253F|nr:signal peptidase I [Paenibacillus daejeonensis]